MYFVYVIKSKKDGKNYTGITKNLEKRLIQHNRSNKSTPSTMNRGPFVMIYNERVGDRIEARKREKYLKTGVGREFIKHIPG